MTSQQELRNLSLSLRQRGLAKVFEALSEPLVHAQVTLVGGVAS
jgi:hypothetical protein